MAEDRGSERDHELSEPFALVGDETRAAVLRVLSEHHRDAPEAPGLSFTELRTRCGVRDSGKFNYHLGRLEGTLVEKSEDGYHLSFRGFRAVGAMVGGAFDADSRRGPEPVPGDCPFCGDAMTAAHEDGGFRVTCERDHVFQQDLLPSAIDGDVTDAARLMTLTLHQDLQLSRRGLCPICHGRTDAELVRLDVPFDGPAFRSICTQCGAGYTSTPGAPLALHPDVVSFYHDHGVDLRDLPFWDLDLYDDDSATTTCEDPLRVEIDVRLDDETLRVTLDDEAAVVAVERTRA